MNILVDVSPYLRDRFFADGALAGMRLIDDHAELTEALPGTEVLVTSWGQPALTAQLLDLAPDLRLVAHTGATVKFFVTEQLWSRGIRVTQAGQAMARPVAEAALAFTLALLHRIPRFDHAMHARSSWQEAKDAPDQHEILGCRIGVIGASRTGRAYIALAKALGAEVSVADPYLTDAADLGVRAVGLDTLLAKSRIVVVHAPVLPETRHLIGKRELALMADGAGLVNTARSWLVDQDALLAEVSSGRLDAAIDVYDEEPLPAGDPLRGLPNVLLTPHTAGATVEGHRRQGDIVLAEIGRFSRGEPLLHEVTAADLLRMG
ncbi:hydroxyacid dehydrogenase [Fodinicola acaciae]|uniref:hydroxyacid dehydrogenase n=1 Tax=Fodinicola acaciae TaxID=2681555 RepID=UPI001C9E28B9|nr:hydroxyacid dehydrogenase [Fodinicola acaciae]